MHSSYCMLDFDALEKKEFWGSNSSKGKVILGQKMANFP